MSVVPVEPLVNGHKRRETVAAGNLFLLPRSGFVIRASKKNVASKEGPWSKSKPGTPMLESLSTRHAESDAFN
jgi:hypothetical protein